LSVRTLILCFARSFFIHFTLDIIKA
jgi:hypothetical protein